MLATDVIERAEKRIGQTLCGKWHLDRVIGVGGMAAVYEATHRNRNRVAIKLLHPELSLDEGTRARFLREGYVANTIRHPGAVQVLDDDVTQENVAFLVMELLHGESLEERIQRKGGALEAQESLLLMEQLLDILASSHDQGVVHRDIKPDNLFLTQEGVLKVLDFGIARLHQGDSRATKVGSFMGTPAFCAPEQARGRWDEVDARTDLFSVGATLFTMLSGTHVHEAETSSEQLALAISATARSLSAVCPEAPQELVELVGTALAYDKEDRFQTARVMRAAVQRVLAGLPKTGKVSGPPPAGLTLGRDARPPAPALASSIFRNHRLFWGVIASGALAALLVLLSRFTHATAEPRVNLPLDKSASASAPPAALTGKVNQPAPPSERVAEPNQTATNAKPKMVKEPHATNRPSPSPSPSPSPGTTTSTTKAAASSNPPAAAPPAGDDLFAKRY